MSPLAPILLAYFTAYLVTQRAMSQATIRAYRDTWRLLLTFLSGIVQVPAHQLQLTDLDPAHVVAFLDYLEQERGNSAATRNWRASQIPDTGPNKVRSGTEDDLCENGVESSRLSS